MARVAVNRIWRWHFGRGLVESTDNFGKLGDRPTNQALLDWLAIWFQDHKYSIKELHRLIVSSSVYRQSSQPSGSQSALTIDPDNRLLWRFPIRRLEAEAIRDSLLFVSDQIELTMGGSLLHVGNREYLFDHTSKDTTKYDSRRRTVYLPVIRNNLYDLSQLFDATDATVPSGDRATSVVPTQALFMLNSPLVVDAARQLGSAAQSLTGDNVLRVQWLTERCLGRPATQAEIERGIDFLTRYPTFAREPSGDSAGSVVHESWIALCQAIVASNEFIYVQ
jgi:hypothetical protein